MPLLRCYPKGLLTYLCRWLSNTNTVVFSFVIPTPFNQSFPGAAAERRHHLECIKLHSFPRNWNCTSWSPCRKLASSGVLIQTYITKGTKQHRLQHFSTAPSAQSRNLEPRAAASGPLTRQNAGRLIAFVYKLGASGKAKAFRFVVEVVNCAAPTACAFFISKKHFVFGRSLFALCSLHLHCPGCKRM